MSLEIQSQAIAAMQWTLDLIYKLGSKISDIGIFISENLSAQIIIGLIAALIAVRNYLRKSGISIHGGFSTSGGYQNSQPHISEIILINQKDRPVTIYKIYLKVGHNYYLELHDAEDSPITLKAYESLSKAFPLPYAYGVSTKLVETSEIIRSKKTKKRLVLATDYGKYEVRKNIQRWNPIIEGLQKNYFIGTITPIHVYHEDRAIGDNVLYCIETSLLLEKKSYYIYKHNTFNSFYNIKFSDKEIASKEALMKSIRENKNKGLIPRDLKITIKEPYELSAHLRGYDKSPPVSLKVYGLFFFHIVGKLYTLWRKAVIKFQKPIRRLKQTVEKVSKSLAREGQK